MHGIEVALIGRLGSDAQLRKTGAGKDWVAFSVAVKQANDEVQWVSISFFNDAAPDLGMLLLKGVEVYVEGRLRLTTWTKGDEQRAGLGVNASKVEPIGLIGKRRPARRRRKPREPAQPQPHAGTSGGEVADLEDAA